MRGRLWKDGFVGVVAEGVEREVMVRFRGFGGVYGGGEDILVSCG